MASTESTPGLHGAIWRWHFYAGLFAAPVMVLLAVTGALYLFNHEIEERWYADRLVVRAPAGAVPRPIAEQIAAVQAAVPEAKIRRWVVPRHAHRAAEAAVQLPDGSRRAVFVDPYRARITGTLDSDMRLMTVVSELHGSLMLGRFGDTVIELAACWGFVLLVTGLYLWWPRGGGAAGVLWPRFAARGRVWLRDLHAVTAFWNAAAVAFLILTGLPWAGFWGDQLARLGTISHLTESSPNFRGARVPRSSTAEMLPAGVSPSTPSPADASAGVAADHAGHAEDPALAWSIRKADAPRSAPGPTPLSLADAIDIGESLGMLQPGARIGAPNASDGVFRLSLPTDDAFAQRTVYLDQYSGAVLGDVRWRDYSPVGKAADFGVSVHMGRQFGLANQLLGLAACLGVVVTAVAGVLMWWRRRPRGAFGAPRSPPGFRLTRTVVLSTLALSVVFPLVGLSLAVVLCVDALWRAAVARPASS